MENRQPRPWPAVEITRAIPPENEPTPPARAEANQTRKGRRQSPETRAKISEAKKGRKHSPETRARMSEAKKGERNPNYGKKRSPETRARISEAKKGERNPNYGKKRSPETRARISEAKKGEKHYLYDQNIDKVRLAIAAHVRGELMSQASRNQGFGSGWLGSWKLRHPERFRTLYMQLADGLDRAVLRGDIGAYVLGSLPKEASFDRDQSDIGLARRALRLCYNEDLSTAEASQELGLDPGWLDQYQQTHPLTCQKLNSIIRHSRG